MSWTRERGCYLADGKYYAVLIQSNSQGPAPSPPCRCKDPQAVSGGGAPAPTTKPTATYAYDAKADTDLPGGDIACNGQTYWCVLCVACCACCARARVCRAGGGFFEQACGEGGGN